MLCTCILWTACTGVLTGLFQLSVEEEAPVSYPRCEDLEKAIHIEHIPKVVKCPFPLLCLMAFVSLVIGFHH